MPHVTPKKQWNDLTENLLLKKAAHPNILQYIDCFVSAPNYYLVTEWVDGATLRDLVLKLGEEDIAFVAKELLKAITYLHTKKMVHRDIKCRNILVSYTGVVKLIDFGLCALLQNKEGLVRMCGTFHCMAPEIVMHNYYSLEADIWSFGICLLEVSCGSKLFSNSLKTMYKNTVEGVTVPKHLSKDFQDFLSRCLQKHPVERATAEQLLQHNFLTKSSNQKQFAETINSEFYLLQKSLQMSGLI